MRIIGFASCLLLAWSASTVSGQIITRITPEAAAPGDLVILTGTGMAGVNNVQFYAYVGGFVGTWTVNVTPLTVSSTRVTVNVPQMAGFIPPGPQGGNPVGTVTAMSPLSPTVPQPGSFYYMQAVATVTTVGTGTTQLPAPIGKPVIAFTLSGGPPVPGNSSHVLTLENAQQGVGAWLVVGFPATPPYIPIGDGTVVVDIFQPFFAVPPLTSPPFPVNPQGDILFPLPIPPVSLGATFMLQWYSPGSPIANPFVSNGLQVTL